MYPIMLAVDGKFVVIVGGGRIALRKAKALLEAGAVITIVSPVLKADFSQLPITWKCKTYEASDLKDAFMIFACTDDDEVNRQVSLDALPHQLVNITSDQSLSNFHNAAVVKREDCVYAISTQGKNPGRAKRLMSQLEQWLNNK